MPARQAEGIWFNGVSVVRIGARRTDMFGRGGSLGRNVCRPIVVNPFRGFKVFTVHREEVFGSPINVFSTVRPSPLLRTRAYST